MTQVLILGAGPMAAEYAKVLHAMQIPFTVVGKSLQSAANFQTNSGFQAIPGGYEAYFSKEPLHFSHAIIAVNENILGEATRAAIAAKIPKLLVEKPGGIDAADIRLVKEAALRHQAQVFVGYNRRFYSSVQKAQSIIAEDLGVLSFHFEFTEWGHVIADLKKETGVKENWFLANSSHVIDLAFYLGGAPEVLKAFTAGSLSWHPKAAIYAGAGMTKNGALFSYQANWQSPGRWAVELLTAKHRLILKPMEKLFLQKIGSVALEEVALEDALDRNFKPGLYKQTEAFLQAPERLPTIDEQVSMLDWYEHINH